MCTKDGDSYFHIHMISYLSREKNRPWGFWISRWMNRFIGELCTLKYFEERVLPIQGRKYRVGIRDVTNHVGTYIGANFDVWVVFPPIPFRHGPPQQQ